MPALLSQNEITLIFQQLSVTDDHALLWRLHELYFSRLYSYILAIVGTKEVAEELTDDVFVDIWQRRSLLANVNMPEVYLFVCAKNRAFRSLKQEQQRVNAVALSEETECILSRDPHDLLISREVLQQINEAIALLPPKCQIIFRMVKENDLKYREVAELLNISIKTVEKQMSIALSKLSTLSVLKNS